MFWLWLITEGALSRLQQNSSLAFRNHWEKSSSIFEINQVVVSQESPKHTLVLPFSMPGKAAVSALLNSPLGLWVSLKIKDFKYILHDLVSKINIKFKKIYIYRKERKIFVHFIVSKTYSKLLRLHMPRFLLKKAKPGYDYDIRIKAYQHNKNVYILKTNSRQ